MTVTERLNEQATRPAIRPVVFDLYRDIHKGIRAELFAVTNAAGSLDPADGAGRADLERHVHSVMALLVAHATHEDACVQPAIEAHLPALAESIAVDHVTLEARIEAVASLATDAVGAPAPDRRRRLHEIYLELASFSSAYLAHQDDEERLVMPALEQAIGVDAVIAIHGQVIASLTPEETAMSMPLMLPAMNVEDRTELLGGMRANAPAEAFAGMWSLAGSVLTPADHAAVAARLGITAG